MCLYMSPWHRQGNSGAPSGGDELERKMDRRNQWTQRLFLAWTHFTDLQLASRGRSNSLHACMRCRSCDSVICGFDRFVATSEPAKTTISVRQGIQSPLTLKQGWGIHGGWSRVGVCREMNREPLVFSHQEHHRWGLGRINAKNKMWSNSPGGCSV